MSAKRPAHFVKTAGSTKGATPPLGLTGRGDLVVTCWCEKGLVLVPAGDVAEGRTRTCGLARCQAPA